MQNSLVLVYAMRPEAALIHQRLGPFEPLFSAQGISAWTRRAGKLTLLETGIGRDRVRAALGRLSQHIAISGLLSIGYAGALDPRYAAGDLIVASRVIRLSGLAAAEEYDADHAMTERALAEARAMEPPPGYGVIATADRFVADVDQKRELFCRTGAQAVEMESSEVARFAREAGLPAAFVRAVSDEAGFDLTPWANALAGGKAVNQAFPATDSSHLNAVTEAFRRKSILASDRLARFVARFCASH